LFFVWPVVALTLLADYAWVALCFGLSLRVAGVKGKWAAFRMRFFAVFVASFGADALLAGLLLAATAVAQSSASVAAWLAHPFAGLGGTLAALGCILAVLLCGVLKWALYRKIVFKRAKELTLRQVRTVSALMAALTAPWTFLLPTAAASGWIGEILIAIGGLAGGVSPEAAVSVAPVP
jgi:hypothetical protein